MPHTPITDEDLEAMRANLLEGPLTITASLTIREDAPDEVVLAVSPRDATRINQAVLDLSRCVAEIGRLRTEVITARRDAVDRAFDRLDEIDFTEGNDSVIPAEVHRWMSRVKNEMFPDDPVPA